MLPNAFASNYIKRGWNVWKTDLYIKFGFHSGYQQWQDLMCVFSFKEKGIMKIIALDICWNNQYGQLSSKREQSCTNMHWAIKWRMWIPYSRVQTLFFLRVLHSPVLIIKLRGHRLFSFLHACQGNRILFKCLQLHAGVQMQILGYYLKCYINRLFRPNGYKTLFAWQLHLIHPKGTPSEIK